jgi:hypothetical protein
LASSWYLLPNLKGFVVVALEREAADYVLGRDAVVRLERERCGLGLLGGWGPDGDAPAAFGAHHVDRDAVRDGGRLEVVVATPRRDVPRRFACVDLTVHFGASAHGGNHSLIVIAAATVRVQSSRNNDT